MLFLSLILHLSHVQCTKQNEQQNLSFSYQTESAAVVQIRPVYIGVVSGPTLMHLECERHTMPPVACCIPGVAWNQRIRMTIAYPHYSAGGIIRYNSYSLQLTNDRKFGRTQKRHRVRTTSAYRQHLLSTHSPIVKFFRSYTFCSL